MSSDGQPKKPDLTIWLSMENVKKIEIVKSVKCSARERRGTREFGCSGNMSIENSILNDGSEQEKKICGSRIPTFLFRPMHKIQNRFTHSQRSMD